MAAKKLSEIAQVTLPILATDAAVSVRNNNKDVQIPLSNLVGLSFQVTTSPNFNAGAGQLQIFVSTTGSDSNTGSISSPFATIQRALDYASIWDYLHLYIAVIQFAAGTYSVTSFDLPTLVNQPHAALVGDFSTACAVFGDQVTPSNVVLSYDAQGVAAKGLDSAYYFDGFQINLNNANDGFWALGTCIITADDIIFNTSDTTNNSNCFNASRVGRIIIGVINFHITVKSTGGGGLTFIFFAQDMGSIQDSGVTWTFSNSIPAFAGAGAVASLGDSAKCFWGGGTVTNPSNLNAFFQWVNSDFSIYGYGPGSSIHRNGFPGGIAPLADVTAVIAQDPLYQIATPLTGATVTITPGGHKLAINPAGAIAALTIILPSYMVNGEIVSIASSQNITTVTWQAATTFGGGAPTIVGAPTGLTASVGVSFVFNAAANTWYIF